MKNRIFLLVTLFFISILYLWGLEFNNLTLSNDDRLLFRADFQSQHAIYLTRLTDMSMLQLTAFPEKIYIVEHGRTLLALNSLGAVSLPVSGGLPSPLPGYPSFSSGNVPLRGRTQDIAPSADGRWFIYIEPTSPGYGNLLLIDLSNGTRRVVSEKIELPGTDFPVKWSPDSRLFVYEKGGRLYYFPILSDVSVLIDERFRLIGPGGINSVSWGSNGHFYYYTGNTLYHVMNPELFTRTIYGDFLSIGRVAAVLPLDFDFGFDRFWIAPDSGSILINKNGKGFFFFMLGENRNNSSAVILPHVPVPFGAENINVLWSAAGRLAVIFSLRGEISILHFEVKDNTVNTLALRNRPVSANALLSPDGSRAVFWGDNGLELWDFNNWRLIQTLGRDAVFSCAWINNRQIITGNSRFIEEINVSISPYPRRRISLSGAAEFGFEDNSRGSPRIIARAGSDWFATDGRSAWVQANDVQLRQVSFSSDRFRVFLEPQSTAGHYRNIPMIRSMQATGTLSLVSRHSANHSFTLGRPAQIALCFDLYDDDTGLAQVLSSLRRHNVRATFFLNGEFIRRNPLAVAAIVNAGHEAASLFYSPIDLSDARYRISQEFIARGLARNEDEFNRVTGKELSILWHPPFYRTSNIINAAAAASGYLTVERTVDPGDYLSRDDALRLNLRQIPPSEMIEQIIQKREPGAVVPIRLGLLPGGRDEYLFQRIDVLIDAFLRSGYEIIPVSAAIR